MALAGARVAASGGVPLVEVGTPHAGDTPRRPPVDRGEYVPDRHAGALARRGS